MNFAWLQQLFNRLRPSVSEERDTVEPTAAVLLLRDPVSPDADTLRFAAERAWGRSFAGGTDDSRHFVKAAPPLTTFIKVGPHLLTVSYAPQPYLSLEEKELRTFLPDKERQQAWRSHRGWIAINYLNKETDEESKYRVLANLASELLDTHCTGIWFPKKSAFLSNSRGAYADLKSLAGACPIDIG